MAQRRTTHRSSKGTKLYAVRKADGTFADVQTYKRAHAADLRGSAKGETSVKSKGAVARKTKPEVKTTTSKAASASGSLLARARKAVDSLLKGAGGKKAAVKKVAVKKAVAKKAPAKRAAKKSSRKKAA